jgi:hypothetical protein
MPHLADLLPLPLSPLNNASVRRKVLIYGAGHGRDQALPLLSNPEWDVWALNLVAPFDTHGCLRADHWFDLHQRHAQSPDDLRWIAGCPVPIYLTPDMMDASPMAVAFPLEKIERAFRSSYWACTFAYQIALAMHLGYSEIALFGVELAYGTGRERTVEWANVAYWIGRAQGYGVRIGLPVGSLLGRHPARYGLEYTEELNAVKAYTDAYDKRDELRTDGGLNIGG